jgi:hypothetical protein
MRAKSFFSSSFWDADARPCLIRFPWLTGHGIRGTARPPQARLSGKRARPAEYFRSSWEKPTAIVNCHRSKIKSFCAFFTCEYLYFFLCYSFLYSCRIRKVTYKTTSHACLNIIL